MTTIQDLFTLGMDRRIPTLRPPPIGPVLDIGGTGLKPDFGLPLGLPDWSFPRNEIPFAGGSVGMIHAYHFLEHLTGETAIAFLREVERVLTPDGVFQFCVPYYNSFMQAQDLTHKSQWNEETFSKLFANPYYDPAGKWSLKVHCIFIMGIVERNLALLGQLVKQ